MRAQIHPDVLLKEKKSTRNNDQFSMTTPHCAPRTTKQLILLLATALALLWLVPDVAAWFNRKPDQAWARVQRDHVLRFAIDASYMPFDGLGSHDDFYGVDVDIANEVARRIEVQAQFVSVSFDGLYDVLKVGQADATISALVIDPARLGNWQYSTSYFDAGLVLITRSDSPIQQASDLAGHALSVEYGSDSDSQARFLARRIDQIKIVYADSTVNVLQNVLNGNADAAIIDGVSDAQLLPKYATLQRAEQLTHDPYAIAVWGDSTQLLDAINSALDSMRRDGTIDRIVDEWMKPPP
jgi:ABC-type amino acid transport substrate-binding protein